MPKIELYPHNQAALNHLEEALKYTRRAAVIQPTGTGKSFVALAFIERRPNNSFLYLAPSTHKPDCLFTADWTLSRLQFGW